MRLNEAKRVVFEDVTFLIYRSYGDKRHYLKKLIGIGYNEDAQAEEKAAFYGETEGLVEEALAGMVLSIEGLVGDDGEPITKWQPGLLAKLPEACGEMLSNFVSGVKTVEEGNASSESASAPVSSTAGTP